MKNRSMVSVLLVCLFAMPLTGMAHDPAHDSVPVEIEGSSLAEPGEIHVQVTGQNVEVKGKLDRKRHNNQSLRGHVDVELVDNAGRVMDMVTAPIKPSPGPAKHDHFREFTATLSLPEAEDYTVRVRHSIGTGDHE
jgi:hypothetical protein